MWGSPGGWLRGSSIRAIARRIGHEVDFVNFFGTTELPFENDHGHISENDELEAAVTVAYRKI